MHDWWKRLGLFFIKHGYIIKYYQKLCNKIKFRSNQFYQTYLPKSAYSFIIFSYTLKCFVDARKNTKYFFINFSKNIDNKN